MERYSNILEVSIVQRGGLLSASSLVVAQTMVLLAFVSCCGASSRLVNFLTIKLFKFSFMFDLNFYFVYFFLFGLILGRGGGTLVIFGWVCAARDLKLAPRSRKNVL